MTITRRILMWAAAVVVALFIIAFPLGDSHNGLGKNNTFLADLGQTVWVVALISVPVFLVLLIVAAAQFVTRSRQARQPQN